MPRKTGRECPILRCDRYLTGCVWSPAGGPPRWPWDASGAPAVPEAPVVEASWPDGVLEPLLPVALSAPVPEPLEPAELVPEPLPPVAPPPPWPGPTAPEASGAGTVPEVCGLVSDAPEPALLEPAELVPEPLPPVAPPPPCPGPTAPEASGAGTVPEVCGLASDECLEPVPSACARPIAAAAATAAIKVFIEGFIVTPVVR